VTAVVIALFFVLLAVAFPIVLPLWLGRSGAVDDLVKASFAEQTIEVSGMTWLASSLTVVRRISGVVRTNDYGAIMQLDAQWLCRTPDGRCLLGIAQAMRDRNETGVFGGAPLPIRWTWRELDDVQAQRLMPD
jgi:hypothetical protein